MKRKVDWEEEEQSEREDYSDEESDEEEPESKMFWTIFPMPFPENVLQNFCTVWPLPEIFLFWTPRGKLLRQQRLIPVTNISELVERVLLPDSSHVAKPRVHNTFLDGLAELGVDKRLIKNKKIILSDLLEKEKE